jgi:15-cis-phytoene synthase
MLQGVTEQSCSARDVVTLCVPAGRHGARRRSTGLSARYHDASVTAQPGIRRAAAPLGSIVPGNKICDNTSPPGTCRAPQRQQQSPGVRESLGQGGRREHEERHVSTDIQEAYVYCRAVTRQHAKNFYYAFLFLPKAQRDAIYTVYAFCRYCDDIADDDQALLTQHALLQHWRQELDNCYAGTPTHRITQALQQTVTHYAIPKHYFEELICGVEMDLAIQRYATFSDLEQYCYRVASVVGLACLPIFGATHAGVQSYAQNLGLALQLTNIIRDVKEDAERGRIYLPLEDLRTFQYSETELLQQRYTAAFVALMHFQQQRAAAYYQKAAACLMPGDRAKLVAPEIMAAIYRTTLRKIVRHRYNVFRGRTSLPTLQKVLIWLETALRQYRPSSSGNSL